MGGGGHIVIRRKEFVAQTTRPLVSLVTGVDKARLLKIRESA